jgi:predicted transport protein
MSDIKLFRVADLNAVELAGSSMAVEKTLQLLLERNLETILGVRFLASEHPTGKVHGGRIDSLGIDENGSPVIVEYKRATNENVINQGLFYLDWLLDHRAEFTLMAMKKLGADVEQEIDWSSPRVVCIAGDFTRYDEHAITQIGRDIELYRYRWYEEGFLVLELVNRVEGTRPTPVPTDEGSTKVVYKTVSEFLAQASSELKALYERLDAFLVALGDDVSIKANRNYFAYRRIKNFACVEVHPQNGELVAYLKVSPDEISLEDGFTQDVRNLGHLGTGDLKVRIRDIQGLERAEPLIRMSYDRG